MFNENGADELAERLLPKLVQSTSKSSSALRLF
jgi:hypothetical protein